MHSTGNILLSIAIPTKNRQSYLKVLVEELLTSKKQNFQIVIQDNSDEESLRPWIESKSDSRLLYNFHSGWISVVENCDRVIESCSGEYICMLGDDDGIMLDESLSELEKASNNDTDAVMGPVLNYIWPDLEHTLLDKYGGKLYTRPVKGTSKSEDIQVLARKVIGRGGAMGLEDLPCVYHGFISKNALNQLYDLAGTYFPGPSPDMANAMGLTAVLKKIKRSRQVLVITGHSISSTAGAGTQRKHHGSVSSQRHLPRDTVTNWYPDVPFFWSGPTIYAQSLRSALDLTNNTAFGKYDLACVYAACRMFHDEYRKERFAAMLNNEGPSFFLSIKVSYFSLLILLKRLRNIAIKLESKLQINQKKALRADSIATAIQALRHFQARL